MSTRQEPGGWWCALCDAAVEPSWLGHGGAIAYHQFGEAPFTARHAVTKSEKTSHAATKSEKRATPRPRAKKRATP